MYNFDTTQQPTSYLFYCIIINTRSNSETISMTTMTSLKRSRENGDVETLATANCLMLLSRVGETASTSSRVFECKTCNRQFQSFQALGGHRASHKRTKLMAAFDLHLPKTHECSICGLEFPIGQALGGHMRRHRAVMNEGSLMRSPQSIKKSSSKRVLSLDLNLTPSENDLKFTFKKIPPVVDCLI